MISSTTQEPELLNAYNHNSWRKRMKVSLSQFGQIAIGINLKRKFAVIFPRMDEQLLDMAGEPTGVFKYEQDKKVLSTQGHRDFRQDIFMATSLSNDMRTLDIKAASYILSHISPLSLIALNNIAAFNAAQDTLDSYDMMHAIDNSRSKCGARVIKHRTAQFFSLTQGSSSFEEFVDELRECETNITSDFGGSGDHRGYIKISHLVGMVFLTGVNQQAFNFKLEGTLATHPDCKIDDPWTAIADYQAYTLQKQIVEGPSPEEASSSLASIAPALPSPPPPHKANAPHKKACTICKKPFAPTKDYHLKCGECMKVSRSSTDSDRPRPAPKNPGTMKKDLKAAKALIAASADSSDEHEFTLKEAKAFVAKSERKLLKSAKALLAARASEAGSDDDFDGFSSFVASFDPSDIRDSAMALKALPLTIRSHCPKTSTDTSARAPWFLDNAASYSTSCDPSMFTELTPIRHFSIGGIGSSVVATHVGHLKFLPRSLGKCYLTPSTSVNLISLGYLNSQGANYSTHGATLPSASHLVASSSPVPASRTTSPPSPSLSLGYLFATPV